MAKLIPKQIWEQNILSGIKRDIYDERVNLPREFILSLYEPSNSFQIHQAKTNRRNRQIHNWRFRILGKQ